MKDPRKSRISKTYRLEDFYGERATQQRYESLREGWRLEQRLGEDYWMDAERSRQRGIALRR